MQRTSSNRRFAIAATAAVSAVTTLAGLGLQAAQAQMPMPMPMPAPAAPAQAGTAAPYTCNAIIATTSSAGTSGTAPLGSTKVSDAGACHAFARQAFQANASWSDPAKVCSRYPNQTVEVAAADYYSEMPGPNMNQVASFKVACGGPAQWDNSLKLLARAH